MGTLFVDRKNVELRAEGARLLVYEQGVRTNSVPFSHLERVVVLCKAELDTGLLGAMMENGVAFVSLNPRKHKRNLCLPGRSHNDAVRKIAQYRLSMDEERRARFSTLLIRAKVIGQKRFLLRALIGRPDQRLILKRAIDSLSERLVALRQGVMERERVRGLEGAAAAAYFQGYCSLFAPSLEFTDRNRRPPKDPVNACLSLGYTLAHADAIIAANTAGLDPMIGFYHDLSFGRESLASDLIEPLRPHIDRWVWGLFRRQLLRNDNFSRDKGACLLNKAGRRTYYTQWEQVAPAFRRRLKHYTRLLVNNLKSGDE